MQFLIIHGAFSSAQGNWFPELKHKLESLGQKVIIPQFPEEDETELTAKGPTKIKDITLDNWLKTFVGVLPQIDTHEKLCIISHSMGCVFVLQAVAKFNLKLDSAIFVGPFMDCLPTEVWPYDTIIPDFVKGVEKQTHLKQLIPDSYVLYSDDDPYVANEQSKRFARFLDSSVIKLHKAGHMNAEVDLDEFALVLDLCLTRLDISFTKKYQFLSQKIGAFEYIYKNKQPGKITLDAQNAFKDKMFDFNDVQQEGFATLFTGFVDGYEPHSSYMEYSREAAKRLKKFIRVIIVERADDLTKPEWKEQIRADKASGIKVYICDYSKVKDKIPEPDFGLWDNHHLVIGKFNWQTRKAEKVIVDNSSSAVKLGKKWQRIIMENCTAI